MSDKRKHYKVTTMIQSADIDNNEPVMVQWYSGDDPLQAGAALLSAFSHHREIEASDMPEAARYRTLSATVTIIEEEAPVSEPSDTTLPVNAANVLADRGWKGDR